MRARAATGVAVALFVALGRVSASVELSSSPTTLEDGQGVVIFVQNDRPASHLDAILASCDRTSIVQRVPKRDAVVAAPCDGRATQKWYLDSAGRFVSGEDGGDGGSTLGRRCLDASCFESESSGIFSGDVSLCPNRKRELRGVDWCHAGLDAADLGFTIAQPFAQQWLLLPGTDRIRSAYDGQCLTNRGATYGTGGTSAVDLFQCKDDAANQVFSFDNVTGEVVSGMAGPDGERMCLAVDAQGMFPPTGWLPSLGTSDAPTGAVRFGTLPALRCDFRFTLVRLAAPGNATGAAVLSKPLTVRSRKRPDDPRFVRTSVGDPEPADADGDDGEAPHGTTGGAPTQRGLRRGLWVSWTSNSDAGRPTVEYEVVERDRRDGLLLDGGDPFGSDDPFGSGGGSDLGGARRRWRGVAHGSSVTYSAADMCESPANISHDPWGTTDPGFQHHVHVSGLPTGATLRYRVGLEPWRNASAGGAVDGAVDGGSTSNGGTAAAGAGQGRGDRGRLGSWSQVREMALPLGPGERSAHGVTFLGFGDMGASAAQQGAATMLLGVKDVLERGAAFVLHFGDLSYGCGVTLIWDAWSALVEPLASRAPYLVSMGNHEFTWGGGYYAGHDSNGECGVPTERRFRAPTNGNGVLWYSFGTGPVHVVQLSSEHDLAPGSEQHAWLDADLGAVDRAATPWVVVTSHRMLYTTQMCEDGDFEKSLQLREALDPLLYAHRVNLLLVGHQHSYERTCPLANGTCAAPGAFGTVHAVIGSAGASVESCGFSALNGVFDVAHANMWGYGRLHADHERFKMQFVSNNDGSVFDEVDLVPSQ